MIVHPLPVVVHPPDTSLCPVMAYSEYNRCNKGYNGSPATYLSSPVNSELVCSPASAITYTVTGTDKMVVQEPDQVIVDVLLAGRLYHCRF
ncbi:MAG: hypothetical protein IPM91_10150 [Bacteroidetes bacterium]|nr:hypothetical protein [Bacteroidota bacterium]